MIKDFFDSSSQYKQLQLDKPSGIEFDLPIHKRLAINLLWRVGQKGPPSGLIGLSENKGFKSFGSCTSQTFLFRKNVLPGMWQFFRTL